ncbi:MAG TPA: ATP-dependent DNA helicase [Microbacteriaceae bacterium]|jgi:superfamily I DNA/RNA helicase|nr:ATP-dependent DNA helicase [Microbacteriaceae bacterium]HPZ33793.1 ATP-dependent DNA helicase [Microbacteriaceae bacterium]HQC93171.1 ATP-dependent DNA helicase [Microbacteriaceae bacterium]
MTQRDAPVRQLEIALDDSQQAVVDLPVAAGGVVFGAPGTGKTTTLVERVARLLEANALTPDEVLVVTPSRATATALRDRLAVRVAAASNGALARSLGSLAFQLVRGRDVQRGDQPPQLLTAGEQDGIIADLLEGQQLDVAEGAADPWAEAVPPAARQVPAFRGELRGFMAQCRELGLGGKRLGALGVARDVPVWRAAGQFIQEYDRVRDQLRAGHYDSSELLREAAAIVRGAAAGEASVLGAVGRLRVLLVDDAQELTLAGVQLLTALGRRGVAVLAFGDPDMSAGAYRGASPEHLDRLGRAVGGERLVLDLAHRGDRELRGVVRSVSERIGVSGSFRHRLAAPARIGVPGAVEVHTVSTSTREADVIARRLRERHLLDGVPWREMAVIAHDTRQVAALEQALAGREVPTGTRGVARLLREDDAVSGILHYLRAALADEPPSAETLTALLLGPLGGMDPITLRRLRASLRREELAAGGERPAAELLCAALAEPAGLLGIDTPEARRASRLADGLREVRRLAEAGGTVHELLWAAWSASRVAAAWQRQARAGGASGEEAGARLDALVALFAAAKLHVERQSVDPPAAFITRVLDSDVPDDTLAPTAVVDRVTVMTPATALGTEFDTVVVAGLQDGVWPNLKARGALFETDALAEALRDAGADDAAGMTSGDRRAVMHDELRLLTRAISRAGARLIVTAVDGEDASPSVFLDLFTGGPGGVEARRDDAAEHPLTLRGVVAQLRRSLTAGTRECAAARDAAGQLARLAAEGVAGAEPRSWYGVLAPTDTAPLRDLHTEHVTVSPSRLDAFRTCEVDWAVRELGGEKRNASTGVGTLIHSAMELMTVGRADAPEAPGADAPWDAQTLWAAVAERWDELDFEADWLSRSTKANAQRMVQRLHGYLRGFAAAGGTLIGGEQRFEFRIPLVSHEGAAAGAHRADDDAASRAGYAYVRGVIDRVERLADGTVVIVDLKTGKSESRNDAGVAENLQLAAYQLAYLSEAIDGTEQTQLGGAQLLLVHQANPATMSVVTPAQPALDEQRAAEFTALFGELARGMARSEFIARVEEHCTDPHTFGVCMIHTVKAVSAR